MTLEIGDSGTRAGGRTGAGGGTAAGADDGTWEVTWQGVAAVTTLELRRRLRSRRRAAVLTGASFLTITGTAALLSRTAGAGAPALLGALVLTAGLLVAPAVSAAAISGDRQSGVLEILQVSLLSPAEIVLGKLLAAWATTLIPLASGAPALIWATAASGDSPGSGGSPSSLGSAAGTIAVQGLLLLAVCALGTGASALTRTAARSMALASFTTAGLTLGLPLLFALFLPLVQTTEPHQVRAMEELTPPVLAADGTPLMHCVSRVELVAAQHSERIWWLLAPSPFVVLADSATVTPAATAHSRGLAEMLLQVRGDVRAWRRGDPAVADRCLHTSMTLTDAPGSTATADGTATPDAAATRGDADQPVWPAGLGADIALGAAAVTVSVYRLRRPAG